MIQRLDELALVTLNTEPGRYTKRVSEWSERKECLELRRRYSEHDAVKKTQHGDISVALKRRQVKRNQRFRLIETHFAKKSALHPVQRSDDRWRSVVIPRSTGLHKR